MMVFLDIGSTLIEGPAYGPARRLAEMLGLGPKDAGELDRLLFQTDSASALILAEHIAKRFSLDLFQAIQACTALWDAQLKEAFVLPGAKEAVAALAEADIDRAYLSNIWPPFYQQFRISFPAEADRPQFLSFKSGKMKPDPAFYVEALRAVRKHPGEAVMIGDTYRNDILPAIDLGMATIWILHRPQKEREALVGVLNGELPVPDLTLGSIAELRPELIKDLFPPSRGGSNVKAATRYQTSPGHKAQAR